MIETPGRELATVKSSLRAAARAGRGAMAVAASPDAALLAAKHFEAHIPFQPGQTLAGFWPIGDEFDPRPIMQAAQQRGLIVGLPVVLARGAPLVFRRWQSGEALETSVMGIPIPAATVPVVLPDVLIVPLLVFDRLGYRLGYGGGYYDRTLAELRRGERPVLGVGLAYAGQERAEVPHDDAFDQRLDWVVTEREARRLR